MRRAVALLLTITFLASGCASARAAGSGGVQPPAPPAADRGLLEGYVKRLPAGARVRASLLDGKTVRGTLMDATATAIVVQERTRIPEPPLTIPIDSIRSVEIDAPGSGIGKAVAIGLAAGASGALGVILLLAAVFSD